MTFNPARQPASILVVFLNALGDCVLSSVFFAGLRSLFPKARIVAAIQDRCVALFRSCPALDLVVPVPVDTRQSWPRVIDELRGGTPFDLAICPRWNVDYQGARELVRLSEAPVRIGFRGPAILLTTTGMATHAIISPIWFGRLPMRTRR